MLVHAPFRYQPLEKSDVGDPFATPKFATNHLTACGFFGLSGLLPFLEALLDSRVIQLQFLLQGLLFPLTFFFLLNFLL